MGAAASLAGQHLEEELTYAEAKELVPKGTWDARWDSQFKVRAGTMSKGVAMMLLAQRVQNLDAACLDWGSESPAAVEAQYAIATTGVKDLVEMVKRADEATVSLSAKAAPLLESSSELEAALKSARVRQVEAEGRRKLVEDSGQVTLHGSGPPGPHFATTASKKKGTDVSFFYECLITKLDNDKVELERLLAVERKRVAWMDASLALNAAKAAKAVARKEEMKRLLTGWQTGG